MIVPGSGSPLLMGGADGYQISRSVRLRSSAGGYFNRTPSTTSNRTTWTWSGWVKRGAFAADVQYVFALLQPAVINEGCRITASNTLDFYLGGTSTAQLITTQVFRDPSAWYHLIVAVDTTQATASNRIKIYINGSQITAFTTANYPSQNYATGWNTTYPQYIGYQQSGWYLDCYMTEINFIDGQALTPTSFGAFDAVTGIWNPIKYSGTYGTNGFYLNFSDNSSNTATTIGKDYSGNGNNWTPNNISVTAGTTYDSMVDVPIGYGSDTGAGGEVRGNYCTFNPLDFKGSPSTPTLANANLRMSGVSTASWRASASTIAIPNQKIYCEITLNGAGSTSNGPRSFGVIGTSSNIGASGVGFSSNTGWGIAATTGANDGAWTNGAKTTLTGITTASGTVYQIAVDATVGSGSNKIWFGQNGTWFNSGVPSSGTSPIFSNLPSDMQFIAAVLVDSGYDLDVNFGQTAFSYTAPSGFKALCTQNLPTPTILNGANYMAASLYTGTGASQTVSNAVNGVSFAPDFVWAKGRSVAYAHGLYDTLRGVYQKLSSNTTGAEVTDTQGLTAFNSTGFTLGTDAGTNQSAATYVGWQWKANGAGSSNTAGSITSTVSANATAGFSVVTYTGSASAGTVGHGLGVAPSMVIVKARGTPNGSARSWFVYHVSIGATKTLYLDLTNAAATTSGPWNDTAPTSTVFSLGTEPSTNWASNNYVAYCFAPIAGYSAFTTYTGNGVADGPFVYCGFRPRWLMIKRYDASGDPWWLIDSTRSPYNQTTIALRPSGSNAEDNGGNANFDFLSNGFKARTSGGGNGNESGATYIVAAFAENPFTLSRAR